MEKEVYSLLDLQCFDIRSPYFNPSDEYQYARMHWVYTVTNDLVCKVRLGCNDSRLDPRCLDTRATVVKSISVSLLQLIAHAWNKKVMTRNIGNTLVQYGETNYTRLGSKFGDLAGRMVNIVKDLYGLTTSVKKFPYKFADLLRSMEFKSSHYDRDVQIIPCLNGHGYEYICTHVDDFKQMILKSISMTSQK